MQENGLAQRLAKAGLEPFILPLLEIARAFGFIAAQALLLGQPLLTGLVDADSIGKAGAWLEDPQQIEQLIKQLEEKTQV